jgi:hypothetical protein
VHLEVRMAQRPALDLRVLWVERLSSTT